MSKTLVWFSEIPWDFLVQRHHHLIENLPSDWRVFFLEPLSRYKLRLRHLRLQNVVTIPLPINGLLLEIPVLGLLLRLFNRIYLPLVLYFYRVKRNQFLIVSSNVFVSDLVRAIGGAMVLYDCHDDVASFPHLPASTANFFEEALQKADIVVCSSQALYSRIKVQKRESCILIGNGVSRSFIDTALNLERLGRQVRPSALGFIGVLSEWIDFELLQKVAEHFPETELLLVGPVVHRCQRQVGSLRAFPNISLVGRVPYRSLPYYLTRMRVGLIPFRFSRLTYSVNPNKLYEYAAFGMQIVSTPFSSDVRQYSDKIRIAETHFQFLNQIENALLALPAVDAGVLKIAQANTWEEKAGVFTRLLTDIGWKGSSGRLRPVRETSLERCR